MAKTTNGTNVTTRGGKNVAPTKKQKPPTPPTTPEPEITNRSPEANGTGNNGEE